MSARYRTRISFPSAHLRRIASGSLAPLPVRRTGGARSDIVASLRDRRLCDSRWLHESRSQGAECGLLLAVEVEHPHLEVAQQRIDAVRVERERLTRLPADGIEPLPPHGERLRGAGGLFAEERSLLGD